MNGTLTQLLSLISYGNQYLITKEIPLNFFPGHTTFEFCKQVHFKITKKSSLFSSAKEVIIANPIEWFTFLNNEGYRELKLFYQHSKQLEPVKDYKLAGMVGGGGSWLIEAIHKDYSDFWYANWKVTNLGAPDNKIWSVQYITAVKKEPTVNLQISLNASKEILEKLLIEIKHFSYRPHLDLWSARFDQAIKALDSKNPADGFYHHDLIIAKNYSLLAQQLIFAAGFAWVFGGMGSWNDLSFETKEDNEKYEQLSESLYEAVTNALIAGINSY